MAGYSGSVPPGMSGYPYGTYPQYQGMYAPHQMHQPPYYPPGPYGAGYNNPQGYTNPGMQTYGAGNAYGSGHVANTGPAYGKYNHANSGAC